ncbi:MAG: serine hydrolase [Oscillatoriales cyanobacterium RM2_1_1]|nr:serine hydrolase [Oscillatoriales cyanobacterium RM2_1_1]
MFGSSASLYGAKSLDDLIRLRDRLVTELETGVQPPPEPGFFQTFLPNNPLEPDQNLLKKLQAVELQILIEQRAEDNWKQALRMATQATDPQKISDSYEDQKQAQVFWQQAISNLSEIPDQSLATPRAREKLKVYQASLTALNQVLQLAESSILEQIRQESGLSRQAMISVCNLKQDCIHLRGDQRPASPASLIKIPIAIALLNKTNQDQVSLEEEVYVEGGNFTEDASDIRARKRYSLKVLMGQMIDHSSNIATNQLIDYLGQGYINDLLEQQGYKTTRVYFKLMGDRIMPFRPGKGRNQLTSNELTAMMARIYNHEYPQSAVLIEALKRQYDHEMGYDGLKGLKAEWLGEKTGQNSRAVGTTLAARIDGEIYAITIIDNRSGNVPQIRQAVTEIAEYILQNGHL